MLFARNLPSLSKDIEVGSTSENNLRMSFAVSLAAMLGSLFFSEVMKLPPCVLCWYQRIVIYPMVVIFGVALWSGATDYRKYILPLLGIGIAIAAYHNLLYYGVIPESISPCVQGVSCTSRQLEWFGFLTIPLMSLLTFILLLVMNANPMIQPSEES